MSKIPLSEQVKYVEQNGSFICSGVRASLDLKYYKLHGSVYKIIYNGSKAVVMSKLSEDEMNIILKCSDLDFGEW